MLSSAIVELKTVCNNVGNKAQSNLFVELGEGFLKLKSELGTTIIFLDAPGRNRNAGEVIEVVDIPGRRNSSTGYGSKQQSKSGPYKYFSAASKWGGTVGYKEQERPRHGGLSMPAKEFYLNSMSN